MMGKAVMLDRFTETTVEFSRVSGLTWEQTAAGLALAARHWWPEAIR